VLATFSVCYWQSQLVFDFFMAPLVAAMPEDGSIVMLTVTEGFMAHLKISIVAGIFFASPVIFYQLWRFIAPGLHANERRFVVPFVSGATVFFLVGAAFAYYVIFPWGLKFLLAYSQGMEHLTASIAVGSFLSFATKMMLAFGVVFELPVVVYFLAKLGLLGHWTLRRGRGIALVVIFIASAVLTPPDVVSQILMATPLIILYELSIIVAWAVGPKAPKPEPEEEADEEA